MTGFEQTVGQRVRLARTARGRGVNELDRLLGSKQGYVSRLESSDREPRADTLRKLAQALGVSLEWLATGEGTMEGASGGAVPSVPAPPPAPPSASTTPVPGSVVVYDDDDPYPNRSRAIALLGHNLDARARTVLLSYRFRSGGGRDEDLPLELWLDEAKNLQRQVRRLDREFAAIEREGKVTSEGDELTGWTPLPAPPAGVGAHERFPGASERFHEMPEHVHELSGRFPGAPERFQGAPERLNDARVWRRKAAPPAPDEPAPLGPATQPARASPGPKKK